MQGGAYAIALAIIVAGIAIGGIYDVSPMPTNDGPRFAFRTNRFTGEISVCTASGQGATCMREISAAAGAPAQSPAP